MSTTTPLPDVLSIKGATIVGPQVSIQWSSTPPAPDARVPGAGDRLPEGGGPQWYELRMTHQEAMRLLAYLSRVYIALGKPTLPPT